MAHAVFSDTLLLSLFNLNTKAESFLLPLGSGSQISMHLPISLHSAEFPFESCLRQLSPISEAGTWCLQATVPTQGGPQRPSAQSNPVTGKPAGIKLSPQCVLGPSQEPSLHLLAPPSRRHSLCVEAQDSGLPFIPWWVAMSKQEPSSQWILPRDVKGSREHACQSGSD